MKIRATVNVILVLLVLCAEEQVLAEYLVRNDCNQAPECGWAISGPT
jgi:hypothetical protein